MLNQLQHRLERHQPYQLHDMYTKMYERLTELLVTTVTLSSAACRAHAQYMTSRSSQLCVCNVYKSIYGCIY